MKKLISMLAVLTMLFSLFATIPAYAEEPLDGTFNVENGAKSVAVAQELHLNLNRALTDEEIKSISLSFTAYNCKTSATPSASTTKLAGNHYLFHEVSSDKKSIRVFRGSGSTDKTPANWTTYSAWGAQWNITVTIGGFSKTVTFYTQNAKSSYGINNEIENDAVFENVSTNKTFKMHFANNILTGRGESWEVSITADGEEYTDFVTTTSGTSATTYNTINIGPKTEWIPGTTYEVAISLYTDYGYENDGTKYKRRLRTNVATFTTAGEKPAPEEPETPVADYTATFENGAAAIKNNTDAALTDAMLVLVAKNGVKLTKVKSVIPFSLAAGATSEAIQCFEFANGETFDFFIWNRATLQPILNK